MRCICNAVCLRENTAPRMTGMGKSEQASRKLAGTAARVLKMQCFPVVKIF